MPRGSRSIILMQKSRIKSSPKRIGYLRNTLVYIWTTCALLFPALIFGEIRLTPDSEIEAIGDIPEPIPIDSLIHASLIASGTPADEMEHYSKIIQDIIGSLKSTITGDDLPDGEALLYWMHSNCLSRYIETQTRLDVLLKTGRYNCV
ncbi:MAG: hypothetical protein B6D68_00285, partial [spirochete symbiont of Stewartia floridana]